MIAPASWVCHLARSELKTPFDHPQSSLKPQGTVAPVGTPVLVRWVAGAATGLSKITTTAAKAALNARIFIDAAVMMSVRAALPPHCESSGGVFL